MNADTLHTERKAAAEVEFEQYDFWGAPPAETGNWESEGQDRLVRTLFFKEDELQGESELGQFTIDFTPGTADIFDAVASVTGDIFGERGRRAPHP